MTSSATKRAHQIDLLDGEHGGQSLKQDYDFSYPSLVDISNYTRDRKNDRGKTPLIPHLDRHASPDSLYFQQVREAVHKTTQYYLESQHPEGYWWSELESNVTITSEYIMLLYLLGLKQPAAVRGMVKYLYNQQLDNGAWALHYGDTGNLSITVETYFALKLAGEDADSAVMRKAKDYILSNGGVEATRVFTKIWLALFSQYDWAKVPSMPVELVLLPPHLYFNIYEFSSWARGTVVPLSIVMAIRPHFYLPPDKDVSELYLDKNAPLSIKDFASHIHKVFFVLDRMTKWIEKRPLRRLRKRAIRAAENWIIEHQDETGDWGGIQPPMVYSLLALFYLGYPLDHPIMAKGIKALEDFCLEDDQGRRMQSCISPVWDTALTAAALHEAELPATHPALQKAAQWLVDNQVLSGGDWQVKNDFPPGGWAFEFVNTRYPDVDDSAVILYTLQRLSECRCDNMLRAKTRGMEWCLSMQSTNGGWAAFDKDNTMIILNRIPFADQEAMVDYPTADVTARMLEAMGHFGYDSSHPRARRALQFLRRLQEPDGCWWGRWGVNYIYGTWGVLRGLISIGEDPSATYIQAAVQWLKKHQNQDGGWGEVCESYARPELRGQGPSTASQTAWAMMGLLAAGEARSPEVVRGVYYLLEMQQPDGTWEESEFTGTGFPNHFYIRYHNYRNCFPLMALGQYLRAMKGRRVIRRDCSY